MSLSRYKPYPVYKDSGIEWLGEIPVHWGISRISDLTTLINGYPFDSELFARGDGVPLVRIRDLGSTETEINYVGPVSPLIENAWINRGDVIIGMDGNFNVARWRGLRALLNQRMCCLRPLEGTDPGFISYLLPFPLKVINDLTYSTTVKHLSSLEVRKIRLGAPRYEEQLSIAAFLDRETARIDALMEKKRRLLDLLREQRSTLIYRAVTQGLDPKVHMKNSGIDWPSATPAHWTARRMAYLVTMISGGTPNKENTEYWRGEIPWVSPKDMKTRVITDSIDHVTGAAVHETGLALVKPPAVLIVVRGMILAHTFPVSYTTAIVTINQDMKALRLIRELDPGYFVYFLEGVTDVVLSLVEEAGHGTKRLRTDLWRAIKVSLPPLEEQRKISAFLDSELARYDKLAERVAAAIDRLEELRTALISAAVTGKIDVREETA